MEILLQNILDTLILGLSQNFGLDWCTMIFGVWGGYLMTKKDKLGILLNIIACCASFSLALISNQYGFLISNVLTLIIMTKAYWVWSSEAKGQTIPTSL